MDDDYREDHESGTHSIVMLACVLAVGIVSGLIMTWMVFGDGWRVLVVVVSLVIRLLR